MTLKDRLKKLAKSASTNQDGDKPAKPKPAKSKAALKEHPLASREDIRDRSKPYHELLDKFTFVRDKERRKSSAGNVSPMGSRRGSFMSFRRPSRDGPSSDKESERRASTQKAHHPGKPHSGDPKALTPIASVQEPRDDEEQEPKMVRDSVVAKAEPSVGPIAEKSEPELNKAFANTSLEPSKPKAENTAATLAAAPTSAEEPKSKESETKAATEALGESTAGQELGEAAKGPSATAGGAVGTVAA